MTIQDGQVRSDTPSLRTCAVLQTGCLHLDTQGHRACVRVTWKFSNVGANVIATQWLATSFRDGGEKEFSVGQSLNCLCLLMCLCVAPVFLNV